MPGVGIIANPHSKLNRKDPQRQELLGYIAGSKGQLRITQNLEELETAIEYFRKKSIEVLAISGGDGTISKTLTAVYRCYKGRSALPKIAILGGGTINTLAGNLGCSSTPEHNLYQLLLAHSSQTPLHEKSLSSLKVAQDIGFIYADGISANFLERFYRNKTNGLGASLLVCKILFSGIINGPLFRSLVGHRTVRIRNGIKPEHYFKTSSVLASTIEKMPLGFKFFSQVREKIGCFETFVIRFSPRELLLQFIPQFVIRPRSPHPKKVSFTGAKLEIGYQKNFIYTLDGELYRSKSSTLMIETGPDFTFVVANRAQTGPS